MEHTRLTQSNPVPYEVEINLDMFSLLVLNRVGGEVGSADVVTIDDGGTSGSGVKLHEKLAEPGGLGDTVSYSSVLGLGARPRDNWLEFGGPGDKIVPEKDAEAGCGLPRVRAPLPIGIGVCNRVMIRGLVELEPIVRSALKIPEFAFDKLEMGGAWVMHE
nr:hypothetical protein [Triticum aestivum]